MREQALTVRFTKRTGYQWQAALSGDVAGCGETIQAALENLLVTLAMDRAAGRTPLQLNCTGEPDRFKAKVLIEAPTPDPSVIQDFLMRRLAMDNPRWKIEIQEIVKMYRSGD